jgi:hypothetical protein
MKTFSFFYEPSADGETKFFECEAHRFFDACEVFHRRISLRYPRYRLLNAYDDQGNSLYLENLTSHELGKAVDAAARVLGVKDTQEPWQHLYGFDPADAELTDEGVQP